MQRNVFLLVLGLCFFGSAKSFANGIYEITVYHFINPKQEITLDTYLQTALLPALHRNGKEKIGVFKPLANDTAADKLVYVIIPFESLNETQALQTALLNDAIYIDAGKEYLAASYQNPPYTRMEKILVSAFRLAPEMNLPKLTGPKSNWIYELRSYESPAENYYMSKVKMFNEGGEIDIFSRLNFNAVFYGDVIAGSRMPNLMYLTSFENMAERDAHWKSFTDDAAVKTLFSLEEYKNNVSKADIILMHAAAYSDY